MSLDLQRAEAAPITSIEPLVEGLRSAEKPRAQHRLGLEHEKFVYPLPGNALLPPTAVPYEGPSGIGALLERMAASGGYTPFRETPTSPTIALQRGMLTVSLEPGGQLELSGSPWATAREAHAENLVHLAEARAAAAPLGLGLVALGYRPVDRVPQMPWMPKSRYQVMRRTLGARGALALNMMLMTSTGQVSLDWESEEDCVRKTVTTARLTPLLVALYANSPIVEGQDTGLASFRSKVWTQVDDARCGYLRSWFDGSFSYRAYVEWALDAPLLFLRRRGEYLYPKLTFRQLLKEGYEGAPADLADWTDHLSTLFPEVRLKKVMEVRGADCVSAELTGALPALWRGLLYEPTALAEAEALLPALSFEEHLEFHATARTQGLRGLLRGQPLFRLAGEMVGIAQRGLERLDPQDAPLLAPLAEVARSGRSPADAVREAWAQDPRPETLYARFAL
ncbi:glutamate--cysteine ligase [Aggregicoccus sp. 17bor-14]|uniref:glutamate--cysteine ligase n=1 Tax=Myxococcaceae TaxID=31 RepID=UPI00129CC590|nr:MULTISPECIES: glutamate-cysteine ligase family protein [Myxococcaceae]MBF5044716.1 glutamate--cysteine ligase [Simulacricoccus sp. 17bor-14]MRI90460.1 glutamate--cysteine ligase [Aggregicoccus sp. 17bor-14]